LLNFSGRKKGLAERDEQGGVDLLTFWPKPHATRQVTEI
jgi:hypothetical protein